MIEGWITDEIDNLCNVEYGTRVVQKNDGGTIYPVYGGGGATFSMDVYNREDRLTIARFAMSAKCTRFVKGKFFLNDSGLTLSPKDKSKIEQEFLNYQCLAMNDVFYSLAKGSAQKNLDVPAFRKLKLNIPKDINTQRKIVLKIDAIFAEIDKAMAAAEANAHNAEALFQSYLTQAFEVGGENWHVYTIKDLIKIRSGDFLPAKNMSNDGSIDVYGGNGISGKHNLHNLSGENIIIGRVGAKCGNVRLVSGNVWVTDNAFHVSEYKKNVNKEFLTVALQLKNLRTLANQMAQPVISFTTIKDAELKIPNSLEEQIQFLKIKNFLEFQIKVIKDSSIKKAKLINLLKQSILTKAFNGELIKD